MGQLYGHCYFEELFEGGGGASWSLGGRPHCRWPAAYLDPPREAEEGFYRSMKIVNKGSSEFHYNDFTGSPLKIKPKANTKKGAAFC